MFPQQKSGLAAALAGAGAGAENQVATASAADDKAKQEARSNDEAAQQRTLRQVDIARTNATTYTLYAEDMRKEADHDPQRAKYNSWATAAEDGGLNVRYMSASEAEAARKADATFSVNHIILPGGLKPQTGPNGEVLTDPKTGQPLRDGQAIVIEGGHMNPEGKAVINLPASLVTDAKKYGNVVGVKNADQLKEGAEVDADQFFKLIGVAQEGNKKEQLGWVKPQIVVDQATGKNFEKNTNTGEIREAKAIPTSDVKNLAEANKKDTSGEVTPLEKFKQDREDQTSQNKTVSRQQSRTEYRRFRQRVHAT